MIWLLMEYLYMHEEYLDQLDESETEDVEDTSATGFDAGNPRRRGAIKGQNLLLSSFAC